VTGRPLRVGVAAAALTLAAPLLGACGDGGGDRPSVNPSRTSTSPPSSTAGLPSPTRSTSETESPTETESAPETSRPPETSEAATETATPSRTPTREPTPTGSEPAPSEPSDTPSTTTPENPDDQGDADPADPQPWVWWLVGMLVVALAVAIPLLVRSRRRRAWQSRLAMAEGEVTWLARDLVPGLRRAGSREQAAGGWAVSSDRVRLLEDELTALEATSRGDRDRQRALTLRHARRAARTSLETMATADSGQHVSAELDRVALDLETALRWTGP
jgi:hypothetical protein